MTRSEIIQNLIEYGVELLAAREADPRRRDFIERVADLGEAILQAQERHLRVFEEEFLSNPDRLRWELLGRTALDRKQLVPKQLRQLDILGIEPDLLSPLRRLRKETSHTNALSWALDPVNRWLGHEPLETFLRRVDLLRTEQSNEEEITEIWSHNELVSAEVRAEHHLAGYGRADLSISLPRAFILVEVKIDAEERPDQISDYHAAAAAFVQGSAKVPLVVFLTADPDAEPSRPTPHLTFEQLLRDWLPVAAEMDTAEHRYLGSYLASVARVVDVGEAGTFDDWNFARRRRAIDFIKMREIE